MGKVYSKFESKSLFYQMTRKFQHTPAFTTSHLKITNTLGSFQLGVVPRSTIALVLVPLALALFGSLILMLMHKKSKVITPAVQWSIWLILATTLIFKTV